VRKGMPRETLAESLRRKGREKAAAASSSSGAVAPAPPAAVPVVGNLAGARAFRSGTSRTVRFCSCPMPAAALCHCFFLPRPSSLVHSSERRSLRSRIAVISRNQETHTHTHTHKHIHIHIHTYTHTYVILNLSSAGHYLMLLRHAEVLGQRRIRPKMLPQRTTERVGMGNLLLSIVCKHGTSRHKHRSKFTHLHLKMMPFIYGEELGEPFPCFTSTLNPKP
jgi:hypothetical protein